MKTMTGACRFCGQLQTVQVPEGIEDPETAADNIASQECNCKQASQYRSELNRMARIRDTIESTFDEETADFMMEAANATLEGMFDRITVDVNEMKFTMYRDANGKFIFGRRRTIKSREEF